MTLYPCYRQLFDQIPESAVILTPNHRLARFVHQQYALHQKSHEIGAWPRLECYAFEHWAAQLYANTLQPLSLMSARQQKALWANIIAQADTGVFVGDSLVDWVSSAVSRCGDWLVEVEGLDSATEETQLLKRLSVEYQDHCIKQQLADKTGLLHAVINNLAECEKAPVAQVHLLGFDDLTPVQQKLLGLLERKGARLIHEALELDSTVSCAGFADHSTEILNAAKWALDIASTEPGKTVAVVIPDLARIRPEVVRVFQSLDEPGYIYPQVAQHAPGFNISAGQPLAQMPLIKAALKILNLKNNRFSVHDLEVLASPFFSGGYEYYAERALLLADLKQYYVDITPRQLQARTSRVEPPDNLNEILHSYFEQINKYRQAKKTFSDWAGIITALLHMTGWPGQRTLDSLEYQQLKQWRSVLDEFAGLDLVLPPCDLSTAVQHLSQFLYVPFLPQTASSSVQVLGLLEAAGMHFDYLWVTGLNDNVWPEPCQPNPLLPARLQKELDMPRASAQREYQLAQKITRRLAQSAYRVIFSYAQWNNDEPLRPSALITGYTLLDKAQLTGRGDAAVTRPLVPVELQAVEDDCGLILEQTSKPVKGGSAIFKEQSACPFRAYALFRLNAQNTDEQVKGVSPLLRGNFLHGALERVWNALQSQQQLVAVGEEALKDLVQDCLTQAWQDARPWHIGPAVKALELARGQQLVMTWLEAEKKRSAFNVAQHEAAKSGQIGPLKVSLRIDRVDQLDDGRMVVIDYKSGKTNINSWLGPRPDEPQVPLYSLLTENVGAAAFGELSAFDVGLKGVAETDDIAPSLKAVEKFGKKDDIQSWEGLLAYWKKTLEQLAEGFYQGQAQVDPKTPSTCRYCDLHGLCRIGLDAATAAGDDA